jgi:hypothetical protein
MSSSSTTPDRGSQDLAYDYTQTLAESFVDTFKTELIVDRVWRSQTARARDRRLHRLVQPPAPTQSTRRPATESE